MLRTALLLSAGMAGGAAGARAEAPPEEQTLGVLPDPRAAGVKWTRVRYDHKPQGGKAQRWTELRAVGGTSSGEEAGLLLRLAIEGGVGGEERVLYGRGDVVYEVLGKGCVAWYAEQAVAQMATMTPGAQGVHPYTESVSAGAGVREGAPPSAWLQEPLRARRLVPGPTGLGDRRERLRKGEARYLAVLLERAALEEGSQGSQGFGEAPRKVQPPTQPAEVTIEGAGPRPASTTVGQKGERPLPPAWLEGRAELLVGDGVVKQAQGTLEMRDVELGPFGLRWEAEAGEQEQAGLVAALPAPCQRVAGALGAPRRAKLIGASGAERRYRSSEAPEALLRAMTQDLAGRGYRALGVVEAAAREGVPSQVWKRDDGREVIAAQVRASAEGPGLSVVTVVAARGNGRRVLVLAPKR